MSLIGLLCLAVGTACDSPQTANTPASEAPRERSERRETVPENRPARDLSQDEAAGGHTLKKHVGRTDDQLRERLDRERNISAASTWTDRDTAERAIGTAIAQGQDRIQRWLDRPSRANLVLDYDGNAPVGRTMNRGSDQSQPCSHATVVLKRTGDRDYYVLTAYPECRS